MPDVPRDEQKTDIEPNSPITEAASGAADARSDRLDPNDEIPVPIAMSPAEVDERAQVVETLREEQGMPDPPTQADGQG